MRWAFVALLVLVGACGGQATPQAAGATPTRSISPVANPSPSRTPIPLLAVGLPCRLPVTVPGGQGPPGAFLDLPSGNVTPDPASAAANSIIRPGRELVDHTVALYYDRAYSRWLPVNRNAVSPDGAHYAYTDRPLADQQNPPTQATLHVVAVKTGVDAAFDGGDWVNPYVVLDYAAEGIYLITTSGAYAGLWLMDPKTGGVTRVADLSNVQGNAGHGFFWVGAVNPDDPQPIAGVAPDELDRLNLVDGTRVAWFYRPGSSVHFVSQDVSGHPIVIVSGAGLNSTELLLLLGPGISRSIQKAGDELPNISDPLADRHGIWFGATDGIYLYSEVNGLEKVSDQPGLPANGCL